MRFHPRMRIWQIHLQRRPCLLIKRNAAVVRARFQLRQFYLRSLVIGQLRNKSQLEIDYKPRLFETAFEELLRQRRRVIVPQIDRHLDQRQQVVLVE